MNFHYIDSIKPRISDINYGGHLGHTELGNLLHEIRARFLDKYALQETNINGHALLMHDLQITYKNQAFWNNNLEVKMNVSQSGVRIVFDYKVYNLTLDNETAVAQAAMVLVDKGKMRVVKPELLIEMLENRRGAN